MNIEVHAKYYRVEYPDGFVEIVRRDSRCTSGYMSPYQITRIAEIEAMLDD